ncbi:hypothetical protein F5Y01DRAFT_316733 [Xylaria sp. FL0043]|nr:hypothetical protein F5Y01DRAFT_316733 [Xylaria sp. FL0043]
MFSYGGVGMIALLVAAKDPSERRIIAAKVATDLADNIGHRNFYYNGYEYFFSQLSGQQRHAKLEVKLEIGIPMFISHTLECPGVLRHDGIVCIEAGINPIASTAGA